MLYLVVAKYRNHEKLDYFNVDAATEEKARAWYHFIRSKDYVIQYVKRQGPEDIVFSKRRY